jgi:hypothetical protein
VASILSKKNENAKEKYRILLGRPNGWQHVGLNSWLVLPRKHSLTGCITDMA